MTRSPSNATANPPGNCSSTPSTGRSEPFRSSITRARSLDRASRTRNPTGTLDPQQLACTSGSDRFCSIDVVISFHLPERDSAGLLTNVSGSDLRKGGQVEHIDLARLRTDSFRADERVSRVGGDGDAVRHLVAGFAFGDARAGCEIEELDGAALLQRDDQQLA